MVVNCAACYNRMKVANHEIAANKQVRAKVAEAVGRDYDGSVKVRHLLEVLLEMSGPTRSQRPCTSSLAGLKVACYYGCLLVRPQRGRGVRRPGESDLAGPAGCRDGRHGLEWPHKVECCGGGLSLSRTDVVVNLTDSIVGMAKAGRRRVHRGQLPHVPDQSRHAAAGHRQGNRQALRHAGPLHHATARACAWASAPRSSG